MGSALSSKDLQEFLASIQPIFADRDRADTLDHAALARLEGEELAIATERVFELERLADWRSIQALMILGSKKAIDTVVARAQRMHEVEVPQQRTTIAAVAALQQVGRGDEELKQLSRIVGGMHVQVQEQAAKVLLSAAGEDTLKLRSYLHSSSVSVRMMAVGKLLDLEGMGEAVRLMGTGAWICGRWFSSTSQSIREFTIDTLDLVVQEHRRGLIDLTSPPDEPTADMLEVFESLRCAPGAAPWSDSLAVDAMMRLDDMEKWRIELALIGRMSGDDHRVPLAISFLGTGRSLIALHEAGVLNSPGLAQGLKKSLSVVSDLEGLIRSVRSYIDRPALTRLLKSSLDEGAHLSRCLAVL